MDAQALLNIMNSWTTFMILVAIFLAVISLPTFISKGAEKQK